MKDIFNNNEAEIFLTHWIISNKTLEFKGNATESILKQFLNNEDEDKGSKIRFEDGYNLKQNLLVINNFIIN